MTSAEFFIELIKAYGSIITQLFWPLVVLIIFFTFFFYFHHAFGFYSRKKRMPVTWNQLRQFVAQFERKYLMEADDSLNPHRKLIVQNQIQQMKQAIERKDENEVMKSLACLSVLGLYNDKQLKQNSLPDQTELIDLKK